MAGVGRPLAMPAEERKERIFRAAERLFCDNGYEMVRMADIAQACGMAKKTLYVLFADKEELLKELVSSSFILPEAVVKLEEHDPIEELRARMKAIANHVLSERHINLCRLAISESIGIKGLASTFNEMGLERSRQSLVGSLERIAPERKIVNLPSGILAGMLFGASCGHRLMTALLTGAAPDLAEAHRTADLVIGELFPK